VEFKKPFVATAGRARLKLVYQFKYPFGGQMAVGMRLLTVKLPEALVEGMDELVRAGMYNSRSALIRAAVRDLLKNELWLRQPQR